MEEISSMYAQKEGEKELMRKVFEDRLGAWVGGILDERR